MEPEDGYNLTKMYDSTDDITSLLPRPTDPNVDLSLDQTVQNRKHIEDLARQLEVEKRLKMGAENMLRVYETFQGGDAASKVELEAQIQGIEKKIEELNHALEVAVAMIEPIQMAKSLKKPSNALARGMLIATVSDEYFKSKPIRVSNLIRDKARKTLQDNTIMHILDKMVDTSEHPQVRLDYFDKILPVLQLKAYDGKCDIDIIVKNLQMCCVDSIKEIRASALRALRYLLTDVQTGKVLSWYDIDVFIIRALTKDPRSALEREQAIKLIRAFIDVDGCVGMLDLGILRTLVAVASQPDDSLYHVALETLCEIGIFSIIKLLPWMIVTSAIAIQNASVIAHCSGFKTILQGMIEGPIDASNGLVSCLLCILDNSLTRNFLRPSVELEIIVSVFTDAYSEGSEDNSRLKSSVKVTLAFLKSWIGLSAFCFNNKRGIKSIVNSLKLASNENRKIILEMLFLVFRKKPPQWANTSDDENSKKAKSRHQSLSNSRYSGLVYRLNLVNHYLCILLVVFFEAGLLEAIIDIIGGGDKQNKLWATILIGELLELSDRLLPQAYAMDIQSLPSLFKLASSFEDETLRQHATQALLHIDNLYRNKGRNERDFELSAMEPTRSRIANQRQIEQAKLRLGIQIDDLQFKALIDASKVNIFKDFLLWDWNIVVELLQGPLMNSKRLDEAIVMTKVIKRLLSFYRPFSNRFISIPATKENYKYIRIGCILMKTLVSSMEGIKYLGESLFLKQISEALKQLDPIYTNSNSEVEIDVFSQEKMENSLAYGYFKMLGTLGKYTEGVKLLEKFRIYTYYYHISELRSRDHLIKTIVTSIDYSIEGHPRIILSRVLTSSYKHVRLFATGYLRVLMRQRVPDFRDWGVQLLITQLYDTAAEISEMAVTVLEEACHDPDNLRTTVTLRPKLDHLGDIGNPLMLRFLSTDIGFRYLRDLNYIIPEMENWMAYGNLHYVTRVELSLNTAMLQSVTKEGNQDRFFEMMQEGSEFDASGVIPAHLFGELAKTLQGSELLREKGKFKLLVKALREFGFSEKNSEEIKCVKAMLWAIGHIGSSKTGLTFLEEEGVLVDILKIGEFSNILSIKGTVSYILELISSTENGRELLEDTCPDVILVSKKAQRQPWLPITLSKLLNISSWEFKSSSCNSKDTKEKKNADKITEEILKSIGNLSNHILSNASSKVLLKHKQDNPEYFLSVHLYLEACNILANYNVKFPARRFVHDLFEGVLLQPNALEKLRIYRNKSENLLEDDPLSKSINVNAIRSESAILSPQIKDKGDKVEVSAAASKIVAVPRLLLRGFEPT